MLTDSRSSHRSNPSTSSAASSTHAGNTRSSTAPTEPQSPQVESAVTRLLVAIKQLLESLTLWSNGKMTETQVSDVYVRLGNDFNAAVAAFTAYSIDMRELLGVPNELREVLEEALSHDASPSNLERFLPTVREIITGLLQGLRNKQSVYRRVVSDGRHRRSDKHDRQDSTSQRPTRSGSVPQSRANAPNTDDPPFNQPSAEVASAVPTRVSGSGRRKVSSSHRMQPVENDGSTSQRWIGGFAPARGQPTVATSTAEQENSGMSSDGQASDSRLSRSPPSSSLRRGPSAPAAHPYPFRSSEPIEVPPRPSSTSSQVGTSDDVGSPLPAPAVPPGVKRYSLVDNPVPSSPPISNGVSPVVTLQDSSPVLGTSTTPLPPAGASPIPSPPISLPTDQPSSPSETPAMEKSLAALQQSEALARKASKRFSSFTFSKMTGTSIGTSGGTLGGSGSKPSTNKSINRRSIAPTASVGQLSSQELDALAEVDEPRSPSPVRTRKISNRSTTSDEGLPANGVTPKRNAVNPEAPPVPPLPASTGKAARGPSPSGILASTKDSQAGASHKGKAPAKPSSPPPEPPSTVISIFLQVGRHVKKVQIDTKLDSALTFASLRVLFVDRFSYNPGQDDFPAIYIRDPKNGVQYELEDVGEVKDGCLLSLNIEPLDQIKQHIDAQMANLAQDIKDLKTTVASSQRMSIVGAPSVGPPASGAPATPQSTPRPTEQQFQAIARRLSSLKSTDGKLPTVFSQQPRMQPLIEQHPAGFVQPLAPQSTGGSSYTVTSEGGASSRIMADLKTQVDEVQNLRRDLGVMRQLYVDFVSQTKESLGTLRTQTMTVRDLASQKVGGARAYIDSGKSKLDSRSQTVLTKIEELQDTVEGLKDDVLRRQVTPRANVVKSLKTDIESSKAELDSLKVHISTVKPMWKKTWEEELQNIVEEQQFLNHQEELLEDLLEDHAALAEVFGHVEKVIALRGGPSLGARGGKVLRTGRGFRPPPPDEGHSGLSTVMLEIRGAQVDPMKRMKAIEANQKARNREQKAKQDDFEQELDDFVNQKRLKMTGGAEEVERIRQRKNDLALKAMFSPSALGGAPTILGGGQDENPDMSDGGFGGLTFSKAPAIDEDSYGGGGAGGFGEFTFSKAPPIPDSP